MGFTRAHTPLTRPRSVDTIVTTMLRGRGRTVYWKTHNDLVVIFMLVSIWKHCALD